MPLMHRLAPLFLALFLAACATTTVQRDRLRDVDAAVERAIEANKTPGGVLLIHHDGRETVRVYGSRALDPAVEATTADTIYDLASITKVVATAPSVWMLIDRGTLSLDQTVQSVLPEFSDPAVTIRHLMTHTSGLRPSLDLRGEWSGYEEGVSRALAERTTQRPGHVFRYSDINYILLGEIVRRASGEPLDAFARRTIFEPLGMRDTVFRPLENGIPLARIAPTEDGLRGVVHDPTARRMGGVAGHAGLFSTAEDLAKFATAILRADFFPRGMTEVASPGGVSVQRMAGFDVDSNYSRPRGDLFSPGSFGHTGWTGGFIWIDPTVDAFYVFLSNRVHPDGKGSVVGLQHELGSLVARTLRDARFDPQPRRVGFILGGADAQNGIDVISARGYDLLAGKRVGVITNRAATDRYGNPTIDLLRSATNVTVAAIFSPEHGLYATADDKVPDDLGKPIPVYSLYGERRKPSREQLAGLDALVFDIQDIGTRFYTYISTMGLAMEAAAEAGVRFVVLDRVNPIGGEIVEGPMLEGETDFVAWHRLPVRHGMTVGELAQMFRDERGIDVELEIVPVHGWERWQWQDEAGLPWINTSPNMRSLEAAGLYPGLGLLERAVSVGRGTPTPFEILGAPYIDGARLAAEVSVAGVALEPVDFVPDASIHEGELCHGVRMRITDRRAFRSVDLGIAIASALARLYPDQFPVDEMQPLLRHQPTLDAIRRGEPLEKIRAQWDLREFMERRAKYVR